MQNKRFGILVFQMFLLVFYVKKKNEQFLYKIIIIPSELNVKPVKVHR